MKRIILIIAVLVSVMTFSSGTVLAGPDQYIGDTAIYSGSTASLRPNVLLLFDNSLIMRDAAATGDPYWPYDAFAETFEGGQSAVGDSVGGFDNTYWTNSALTGSVKWARSSAYKDGGTYSQYSAGQTSASDMVLTTRSFGVLAGTTLSFYHTYKFNQPSGNYTDGGTLEYTKDAGTTWTVVPDSAFTAGGFNATIYSGTGNPIAGKRAWGGGALSATMAQVTVNLGGISGLAGNIVKIRWHAGYDNTAGKTAGTGWYIDDILISNLAYSGSNSPWTVYKLTTAAGGVTNYVQHITDTSWDLANVSCTSSLTRPSLAAPIPSAPASNNAKGNLQYNGTYSGAGASSLKSNGVCGAGGAPSVYLGNLLNYNAAAASGTATAAVRIVRDAIASVVGATRETVNFGLMVFGQTGNKGGKIVKPVANLSDSTAYNNFIAALPGTGSTGVGAASYVEGPLPAERLLSGSARPLAEALHDAGAYFKSTNSDRNNVYSDRICADTAVSGSTTSPIQYSCQKNYVIVVSRGAPDSDGDAKLCNGTVLGGTIGDYDGDGNSGDNCSGGNHLMDDVAKFIYENDMSTPQDDTQRVITTVIQVFESSPLSQRAADASHGRGLYRLASNANELSRALTDAMANIVLESDTSFVAPVVPVSPENRTYSGSRVYLGFFKPISQKPWYGNLKKYGINSSNEITDKNENVATNIDGSFKDTSVSYWSLSADAGLVDSGGAGELLLTRVAARNIYTFMGSSVELSNSSNAFTTSNAGISTGILGVSSSADKDKLINFIHGTDSYDEDGDGNATERRAWILGDILHSKPLIVNYATYSLTPSSNEGNCSINKGIIFVGANDGMFHAFKDCDGSEAWAFIPPDLLGNLRYLTGQVHTYFVDSSPSVYKYDADNDGNIETPDQDGRYDKVILMFGERRGGGVDASPTKGYYYALDVSDPLSPKFLWSVSNTEKKTGTSTTATTEYGELGETWSEPKIVNMKIGGAVKVVAVIGAGYDNVNEDGRYGATQTFDGDGTVTVTDTGSGVVTSTGTSSPLNPKGRGVYVVEVATLGGATPFAPSFTNGGSKVWGYTNASNSNMIFSMPSEVAALDTNFDGYVDRFYVGDTGGNIWRFNVGDADASNWTARKIFGSNPGSGGSSDVGRKLFYKPSVTFEPASANIESGYAMLFFGTGDREHPLNRGGVVERMYGLKDKGADQTTTVVEDHTDNTHELVDVTANALQEGSTSLSDINTILASLDDRFGWYIKLNVNSDGSGEKVLSPALAFNKVAYYTTYGPSTAVVTDPCQPGNLGTGRVYAVNYKTGEAAINYDTTNDASSTSENLRASGGEGIALRRSDRVMTLGAGIPSGIVVIISASGDSSLLIGCGGAICSSGTTGGGSIIPLYWRRK